jgi:hypothetical protein
MPIRLDLIHSEQRRVINLPGGGRMGDVYLAYDLAMQILFLLIENLTINLVAERSFRRQHALPSTLCHSNLSEVTDHLILQGQQYLVMGFVAGKEREMR